MRKVIFVFFSLIINGLVAQNSLNSTVVYHWDSDTIPGSYAYNNSFNEVWGMEVNGREFAVMGSTLGTHIFDVTDPETSSPIFFIPGAFSDPAVVHRDYHDYQGYLYAVSDEGSSTLQIIDISNLPTSIEVVYDSNELMYTAHNVFIDRQNAILYACGGSQELSLFSLENPESPSLLLNCQQDVPGWSQVGYVHDLYVRDGIAYCHAGGGFYIVDFSNLNTPQFLGSLTTYQDQGYNHSGWLNEAGNIYAMADETTGTRIKILDVSDPSDINVLSLLGTDDYQSSIPHNVIFVGDKLHISYYSDGYYLFDVSNPQAPELEAYYYTCSFGDGCQVVDDGAWGVYPLLSSGRVLVSDQQNGLFVVEVAQDVDNTSVSDSRITDWQCVKVGGAITISGLPENEEIKITLHDQLGRKVHEERCNNHKNKVVGISDLSSGIYFVTLRSLKKEKTFKIVK